MQPAPRKRGYGSLAACTTEESERYPSTLLLYAASRAVGVSQLLCARMRRQREEAERKASTWGKQSSVERAIWTRPRPSGSSRNVPSKFRQGRPRAARHARRHCRCDGKSDRLTVGKDGQYLQVDGQDCRREDRRVHSSPEARVDGHARRVSVRLAAPHPSSLSLDKGHAGATAGARRISSSREVEGGRRAGRKSVCK